MLVEERKALLRLNERSRWRPEGPGGERALRSLKAQHNFLGAFPPGSCGQIAMYSAVRGEVGTDRIRDGYLAAGSRLYYPRVAEDGGLLFYRHGENDGWALGKFGVREPLVSPHAAARTEGFDLVLVPGMAFDARGRRLGKGYGCYDRFLSGLSDSTLTVGLAFSWQLVPEVPVEEWDVPVDVVVTDEGVIRPARGLRERAGR
jgi:5-formyltetrahydrofolate cyclo-ligase